MQMKQLFFMAFLFSMLLLNAQQKDCHLHTVQPGEGIYSLSRLYTTKPAHIMSVNPEIGKEMQIKVGQKLCIPKSHSVIPPEQVLEASKILQYEKLHPTKTTSNQGNLTKQGDLWIHTVHKSETFYGICKLYQVLAYDMIATNNLPNTILGENQKLLLPPTAIIPNQATSTKPEVSALVEMTNTASAEIKTTIKKPEATKTKKDVVNNSPTKPEDKKKEAKPIDAPKVTDEVKPITSPSTIKGNTHTVQKGETYYSITIKYGLKSDDIKTFNKLASTDLKLGQTILIANPNVATKQQEEEGIPANAHIIDISKEVAKREAAKLAEPAIIEASVSKKKEPTPAKQKAVKTKPEQPVVIKEELAIAEKEVKQPEAVVESKLTEVKQPEVVVESKPTEVKQAEVIVESKPTEVKQPDAVVEAKPLEVKQADAVIEAKPLEVKKTDAVVEAKPIEVKQPEVVVEAKVTEVKQAEIVVEAKPTEVKQAEVLVEAKPTEVKQPEAVVEAKPMEVKQADVVANEVPKPALTLSAKPVLSFSEEYGNSYNKLSGSNNYKIQKTRGVAEYTDAITGNEYLVYYNAAEPGSIIKVTNLMSKQSAYVKVMGGISTSDNISNVSMKVSKKLAQQLQVLDNMFLVEVSSLAKN